MSRSVNTYPLSGGLDTNSPALAVPPGAVRLGKDYEVLAEGYGRVKGYERFDGREAPSAVTWHALAFDEGTTEIVVGDTITGGTSGATGTVVALDDETGAWADSDAAGTLLLIDVVGTFEDNESLSGVARANGTAVPEGAASTIERRARKFAAMAYRRAQITQVPGSGPVRGVAVHDEEVYAWRDNAGGTALVCHRATATGWSALPTLTRIDFNTGVAQISRGDTVTGGTSGATGEVADYIVTTGFFDSSNAVGWVILKGVSGTFQNGEALEIDGATAATATTAPADQAIGPGGRVRWLSHNFYASADLYRLYGCTGEAQAFELIPGAGMVPIDTGMVDDRPTRIFEINNHLGLIFRGGSVQFSGTLQPQVWDVIVGAGEIGFGTEVTDVVQANETAVALFGRNKIGVLQGRDADSFALDTLTEEAGAEPDTAQRVARTVYIDRRGLRDLQATQAYGNFKTGTLSGPFESYLRDKRQRGAVPLGSYVVKTKTHYRLVYDDGTGLSIYMGGKQPQALPFSMQHTATCFGAGELANDEGVFFGADDGFVYRLESGNSWDGVPITAYVATGYNHFGAPSQYDRFMLLELELDAPGLADIRVLAQFNYGDGSQPNVAQQTFEIAGGGGLWDVAEWSAFNWSAPQESRAEADLDGIGRNASFIFATVAALDEDPHVLSAYAVHRSPRRVQR